MQIILVFTTNHCFTVFLLLFYKFVPCALVSSVELNVPAGTEESYTTIEFEFEWCVYVCSV